MSYKFSDIFVSSAVDFHRISISQLHDCVLNGGTTGVADFLELRQNPKSNTINADFMISISSLISVDLSLSNT